MRLHIVATVTHYIHEQVREFVVGPIDDDTIDAAIDTVFRNNLDMIGGCDFESAEITVGGYAEFEAIDLDGGDPPDPYDLDLEDIRNIEHELASRSGRLDDIIAEAIRRANGDRDPDDPPAVPQSRVDELGPSPIPLWNWSDAEVSALLGMIDAIDTRPATDGQTVALRAVEEGYNDPRFWLVVTDDTGRSEFRCDGFLAPVAQIDAAVHAHRNDPRAAPATA
ncbi:hypothetical protein DVS28_b0153 (plasmid) [Euzebya pacifica]|uniref:Uncharacterized protein n=1 Tax=Euzebya pacifica TaxID=1608957 RepID=A0A346Y626_9ACTN|nr:hypothetical protein [Euzebya pacifica]AXV09923.1 hypothetical protein DVS28_b0153 [Euzebya pacifica]